MICHEKSFFAIFGNISTELVRMTTVKWTFHTLQKQEFGSIMVAEDTQLNEQTQA